MVGIAEDYRIWATPSELNYSEVEVPIRIWHGDADEIVPMHHAEYVAGVLPAAELVLLPGVGHLHTAARWHHFITTAVELSRRTPHTAQPRAGRPTFELRSSLITDCATLL
jgi:pimeloyl-ACP methyl ester carboxylesterase